MATKHSKDHYRVINGKMVHVKGHDYEVQNDHNRAFDGMFADMEEEEPARDGPQGEPEQPPPAAPEAPSSDVHSAFDSMFADLGAEPHAATEAPRAAKYKIGDKVKFDDVKPGMVFKWTVSQTFRKVISNDGTVIKITGHDGEIKTKTKANWDNFQVTLADESDYVEPTAPTAPADYSKAIASLPPEPDPVPPVSSLKAQLDALSQSQTGTIGGVTVKKIYSGILKVMKKNDLGVDIKPAIKKELLALSKENFGAHKDFYYIGSGNIDKALALIEGQEAVKVKVAKGPAIGSEVMFGKLQDGMKFDWNGKAYTVSGVGDYYIKLTAEDGDHYNASKATWGKHYKKHFTYAGQDGVALNVGDTKIENGVTYFLNANHKWEKLEKKAPAAMAPKAVAAVAGTTAGWTQVGPQGGAQPGGAFVDQNGQKWYVKFPPNEDVTKNEVLAMKLYALGLGAGSVPTLKTVKAEGIGGLAADGKLGIASKWMDGLKEDPKALADGAPGVYAGFGMDAWLANWDCAGSNESQFKNMVIGPDGKAVRVDAGGALNYTGLGKPKGNLFGNIVTEVDKLLDPAINKETAFIYKGITQEDKDKAVATVLEIPDDVITKAVMKFGGGTEDEKAALAAKLIARKAYLAKRFPGADRIANPPLPDQSALPIDPTKLKPKLDWHNWNGPGKPLSATPAVNDANQKDFDACYALALKGDFTALKAYKWSKVDKTTGDITKESFSSHVSGKFKDWMSETFDYMECVANPASKVKKNWVLEEASSVQELADLFPPHFYGVSVSHVPANEKLGFWISLGNAAEPHSFVPANIHQTSQADHKKGQAAIPKLPAMLRSWMKSVKGSGSANQPYRDGKETDNEGRNCRDVLTAAYNHATEFEEGTTFLKGIGMVDTMIKQLNESPDGHVFQNPGSMCTTLNGKIDFDSFNCELEMVCAKGAKGLYNIGVHTTYNSEGEITTLPGQRFMLLEKSVSKLGKPHFKVLMLPPDQTYIDNIKPAKVV